ncbi:4'-phosphopantetheinyl transferase superfamily protein [Herbivorax sp. ANBcel31]|uniref:4'-phosphopantetheinyl transferase family protein n=1 Tax=Herbivorax sp. ANBcel31 TaxID=3069754 RepID=UPI0027B4FCA9|nr:4'-phosphopantetheinyl transferase superfamily protein [Herbivorax sp. ANBcel31]MDQ2086117.1 4'-phosphopantetheinyl transferase superfamily protein [Herbivorax sp. ANBcel31]
MILKETKYLFERNVERLKKNSSLNYALVDMNEKMEVNNDEHLSFLSKKEIEYLKAFKIYKKKIQWICGRYAVKKAFFKYKISRKSIVDLSCVDVLKGADSAPYILQYPNINVSITHSFPYCVGVISESKVGVDIEKFFTVEDSLIDFFFSDREKSLLSKITDPHQRNVQAIKYWTRKEAVSKFLRLGMKMNFKELDTVDNELKIGNYKISLFSFEFSDCCLSLAIQIGDGSSDSIWGRFLN